MLPVSAAACCCCYPFIRTYQSRCHPLSLLYLEGSGGMVLPVPAVVIVRSQVLNSGAATASAAAAAATASSCCCMNDKILFTLCGRRPHCCGWVFSHYILLWLRYSLLHSLLCLKTTTFEKLHLGCCSGWRRRRRQLGRCDLGCI